MLLSYNIKMTDHVMLYVAYCKILSGGRGSGFCHVFSMFIAVACHQIAEGRPAYHSRKDEPG